MIFPGKRGPTLNPQLMVLKMNKSTAGLPRQQKGRKQFLPKCPRGNTQNCLCLGFSPAKTSNLHTDDNINSGHLVCGNLWWKYKTNTSFYKTLISPKIFFSQLSWFSNYAPLPQIFFFWHFVILFSLTSHDLSTFSFCLILQNANFSTYPCHTKYCVYIIQNFIRLYLPFIFFLVISLYY